MNNLRSASILHVQRDLKWKTKSVIINKKWTVKKKKHLKLTRKNEEPKLLFWVLTCKAFKGTICSGSLTDHWRRKTSFLYVWLGMYKDANVCESREKENFFLSVSTCFSRFVSVVLFFSYPTLQISKLLLSHFHLLPSKHDWTTAYYLL